MFVCIISILSACDISFSLNEECISGKGCQLVLMVKQRDVRANHDNTVLEPYKNIEQSIESILYPRRGYVVLLDLLGISERMKFEEYQLKKMILEILIHRVNLGCADSCSLLCRYICDRSNEHDCYDHVSLKYIVAKDNVLEQLRARSEKLREQIRSIKATEQDVKIESLPLQEDQLSDFGKKYLVLSTGQDNPLLEGLQKKYASFSKPLRDVLLKEEYGGGKKVFYQYFINRYSVEPDPCLMSEAKVSPRNSVVEGLSSWLKRLKILGNTDEDRHPFLGNKKRQ